MVTPNEFPIFLVIGFGKFSSSSFAIKTMYSVFSPALNHKSPVLFHSSVGFIV
jgi:hypothetical protein